MQTIIIVLNPEKLINPDLDLRYHVPEYIEEQSKGSICDNGYDYIDCGEGGPLMALWLKTEDAVKSWPVVLEMLHEKKFLGNDLSLSAEIYISKNDAADLETCNLVFPT